MDKIFVLQIDSLIPCCSTFDFLNPAFSHVQLHPIHALHLLWMVFCILGIDWNPVSQHCTMSFYFNQCITLQGVGVQHGAWFNNTSPFSPRVAQGVYFHQISHLWGVSKAIQIPGDVCAWQKEGCKVDGLSPSHQYVFPIRMSGKSSKYHLACCCIEQASACCNKVLSSRVKAGVGAL